MTDKPDYVKMVREAGEAGSDKAKNDYASPDVALAAQATLAKLDARARGDAEGMKKADEGIVNADALGNDPALGDALRSMQGLNISGGENAVIDNTTGNYRTETKAEQVTARRAKSAEIDREASL